MITFSCNNIIICCRWKTVYINSTPVIEVRQSNNTADVRPRQLLPLQKMDFVLVGRMPGRSVKSFEVIVIFTFA